MRVKLVAVVTAALAAVLTTAGPALAATSANVVAPGAGAVLSAPAPIRIEVSRDLLDPSTSRVDVRLSADGQSAAPGTSSVSLDCTQGCNSTDSTWGGATVQPATTAPFGSRAVCNGRWYLQPSVNGGAYGSGAPVVFSVPGSPVSGFSVTDEPGAADLRWDAATEPDISGNRIERSVVGGDWQPVVTVGGSQTSYTDDVAAGDYRYRIVTLRPDGQVGGQPAAPCTDSGQDLETISGTRSVTVPPAPSPSPSTTTTSQQSSTGTDAQATSDPNASASPSPSTDPTATSDTSTSSAPAAGDSSSTDTSGGSTSPQPRQRVAPPPAAHRDTQESAAAPALPVEQRASSKPRYYGDDQGYSDKLDYGDAPVVAPQASPTASPTATTTATEDALAAGSVDPFAEQSPDLGRILRPVAVGLLLVAIGLHLRRWMRETDGR